MSAYRLRSTKRFELSKWMHIVFEDRRGPMWFELLLIEPGDEDRYELFTITSPKTMHSAMLGMYGTDIS